MRSKLAYFGLTLLLVGVVCLVVGEVNLANVKNVQIGQQYSVWSYSCNLTSGGTYGVMIESSQDWGVPFASGDFSSPQPVNVTIASPDGGVTSLQAFFWGETTSGYFKEGTPPTIVEVMYQHVDANLIPDYSSPKIRFTVKQSGPYNVTVLQEGLWSTKPPSYILFFEAVATSGETYSLLASVGGVVGTIGGITFVVGFLRSGDRKRRRTHK